MYHVLLSSYKKISCVALLAAIQLVSAPVAFSAADELQPEQISNAIEQAKKWLIRQQSPNGTWKSAMRTDETVVGATALVVLALANAGVDADKPAMKKALTWLREQTPTDTYSVSLQTQALAMVSPKQDLAILERNTRWLEDRQSSGPGVTGGWSYGANRSGADNSNSQFAILGLHEAQRAGVRVNPNVWRLSQKYWEAAQRLDGSWGYTAGGGNGTGSMTCAGIASMWITAEHTERPDAFVNGTSISCCGGGSSAKPLENGLQWLGKNFSVTRNPPGGQQWLRYYLYGLERVGRFTARRFIGNHDWYLEGAKMFVSSQDPLSGSFQSKGSEDAVVATSFALLFLAKGRRPVVIAKSRHGPRNDWNQHGHDISHLVEFIEKRWRDDYPAGLSWHVLNTQEANTQDLAQSPVLWIGGTAGLDLGKEPGRRLREYIDQGGFIFAEATCTEGAAFDKSFRQLVSEIFPEPEHQLSLLPPEHPAWYAEKTVAPDFQRPLLGVDYGCRTCLIYAPLNKPENESPRLPSLSCLWELAGPSYNEFDESIRKQIDASLAIGANVIAYATNRELKKKDELFARSQPEDTQQDSIGRGQLTIGKLRHGGLCDAAPKALANILRAAARELGILVDDTPTKLDLIDPAIFKHHMLFMHGRQAFVFDDAQRKNLRDFLERGGTLLADSVCASQPFTNAFRKEFSAGLPDHTIESIPNDDPLFSASTYGGFDLRQVTLRAPTAGGGPLSSEKRKVPPQLEGIRMGDRWAVIFSPFDISCALEKQNSMECTGYDREDAEKIALNILLYSLNQ